MSHSLIAYFDLMRIIWKSIPYQKKKLFQLTSSLYQMLDCSPYQIKGDVGINNLFRTNWNDRVYSKFGLRKKLVSFWGSKSVNFFGLRANVQACQSDKYTYSSHTYTYICSMTYAECMHKHMTQIQRKPSCYVWKMYIPSYLWLSFVRFTTLSNGIKANVYYIQGLCEWDIFLFSDRRRFI